jgi:mRNA interferase RelE/StbE
MTEKYSVYVTKTVQKQLAKLPNTIADRLETKMLALENDPRPPGAVKLTGRDAYRIRVGDYRFIYDIQDAVLIVDILKVAHRKDIYK